MEDCHDQLKKLGDAENPSSSSSSNNNDQIPNWSLWSSSSSSSGAMYNFDRLPLFYRFDPTDEEFVELVLKKLNNQPLTRNKIRDVEFYNYTPDELAEKYKQHRTEKEWLYFTPRAQKHEDGNCASRTVKDNSGFWRRTKSEQVVRSDSGEIIGFKDKFVFHMGEPSKSGKTNWFMQEYSVLDQTTNIKFDDWVLCKVYKRKVPRSTFTVDENEDQPSDYEDEKN
ncbi:NAC domain containing protein [Trema orientale]|uniref:NAC domain containing protein n=1 Tax=Trema orientale TaxID=63057 RepID=A0A2P5FZ85_TREOI|nr:NAC domain containing protein [Trema orientale]